MSLSTLSGRAGDTPKRNELLRETERKSHARNQAELVEAINQNRDSRRIGLKVAEFGKEGPASFISQASGNTVAQWLNNLLKTQKVIKRIELFKDSSWRTEGQSPSSPGGVDYDKLYEATNVSKIKVTSSITDTIARFAEKVAEEFTKPSVAGVDADCEGNFVVYVWKGGRRDVSVVEDAMPEAEPKKKSGRPKKDSESTKETKLVDPWANKPYIRLYYALS